MDVGRSDADDERRRWSYAAQIDEVHVQNFTEELWVRSEAPLPEAAADNDLGSAPLWIARIERFTHQPDAENFEKLRRDAESAHSLATIASGQVDRLPSIAGDRLERFRLGLPVEQVRRRNSSPEHTVGGI